MTFVYTASAKNRDTYSFFARAYTEARGSLPGILKPKISSGCYPAVTGLLIPKHAVLDSETTTCRSHRPQVSTALEIASSSESDVRAMQGLLTIFVDNSTGESRRAAGLTPAGNVRNPAA